MKALKYSLLWPVAAGMLVSGCAATNSADKVTVRQEIDREYVAAVERSARGLPVAVIWVNPPTRRVERGPETESELELHHNRD